MNQPSEPPCRRRPLLHPVQRTRLYSLRLGPIVIALATACSCAGDSTPTTAITDTDTVDTTTPTSVVAPSTVAEPSLRAELRAMFALDQAVRGGPVPDGVDPSDVTDIDAVDRDNRERLSEIFNEHGWPGWRLVGEDGSTAAWAIVQHADLHPDFQQQGLDLLTVAVDNDDASRGDLAYLTDRVLVSNDEPQIYGTQWQLDESGEWVPRTPIADEEQVDVRRDSVGLGTLDDYLAELNAPLE